MNKELLKSVANKICTKTQEIVKKENIVSVPVSDYCIKISRNEFTDKEWKFLVENRDEKEFKYSYYGIDVNENITHNLYSISEDFLLTNPILIANLKRIGNFN